MIPFSPPRVDEKTVAEVTEALLSGWITTGPKTRLFEEGIAEYVGAEKVVALGSATAGLQLILDWFGLKEGDEVIVPAYTYCASANVVVHSGATPVMVDVNPEDFNISIQAIEKAITEKTKAIIAVDVAGFPADYEDIFKIVETKKQLFHPNNDIQKQLGRILVISDAAHSIGGKSNGIMAGMQADISSFSFHAVKNLTTAEGGAVVFNLPQPFNAVELQQTFKTKSLHGQTKDAFSKAQIGAWRYDVVEAGFKCNMTDLQAAIGLVELRRYDETLKRRKEIFELYTDLLSKYNWAQTPVYRTETKETSYHLYMLRIKGATEDQRNEIITKIGEQEVAVNVHYLPLPMLTVYKNKGYNINDFPVAYDNYHNEITLPVWYNLTDEQVITVVDAVVKSVESVLK